MREKQIPCRELPNEADLPAPGAGILPWVPGTSPLMLAPMQGLTNVALRSLFIDWVRPDVVFTEFMRVSPVARRRLAPGDLKEARAEQQGTPLVVQLIGHGREALCTAAVNAQKAGALHINLNLGCPYGRMTTSATGGHLLRHPDRLGEILPALRSVIGGSFSVKLRAGYDDPDTVYELLPLFEEAGVDFLVLHPRTVVQEYEGMADHGITAQVVRSTSLPVIANGDIVSGEAARKLLRETGAAGLMLGRGAISDPLLFERVRGNEPPAPDDMERARMIRRYLTGLLARYRQRFCGDAQVLSKVKGVVTMVERAAAGPDLKRLRKARDLTEFRRRLEEIG